MKKKCLGEGSNACKIKLDEVHEVEGPMHTKLDLIRESNLEPVEVPLRRFDRVPHQANYNFLIRDDDPIELDENDEDPITCMEAMQRLDSQNDLRT